MYAADVPTISNLNTDDATITGFTARRTINVKFNCDQPIFHADISTKSIVGYCHTYVGRYRADKMVAGKYYDGLIIKCCMEPATFYGTDGEKYYGYSQYLQLSSTLPSHCSFQNSYPNNATTGSDSYSVGIGLDSALVGSISGNVNINSDYCNITDASSISNRKFCVKYDYKSGTIFDGDSTSERNKMLFNQTWQMATCEWTTSTKKYNISLDVKARFGFGNSKNGAGIFRPLDSYICTNSGAYSCMFNIK